MSRRDDYLVGAGTPVDDVLIGDVAAAYDVGYKHGTDDAGARIASNPSDIRHAAIADAVTALVCVAFESGLVVGEADPLTSEAKEAARQDGLLDAAKYLYSEANQLAEKMRGWPSHKERLDGARRALRHHALELQRRAEAAQPESPNDYAAAVANAIYAKATAQRPEPAPLSERAQEWADELVAARPSNDEVVFGIGLVNFLAWAARDPDILAALNEAARRLREGGAK